MMRAELPSASGGVDRTTKLLLALLPALPSITLCRSQCTATSCCCGKPGCTFNHARPSSHGRFDVDPAVIGDEGFPPRRQNLHLFRHLSRIAAPAAVMVGPARIGGHHLVLDARRGGVRRLLQAARRCGGAAPTAGDRVDRHGLFGPRRFDRVAEHRSSSCGRRFIWRWCPGPRLSPPPSSIRGARDAGRAGVWRPTADGDGDLRRAGAPHPRDLRRSSLALGFPILTIASPADRRPIQAKAALLIRRLLAPDCLRTGAIVLLFAALCGAVNYGRFGNPLISPISISTSSIRSAIPSAFFATTATASSIWGGCGSNPILLAAPLGHHPARRPIPVSRISAAHDRCEWDAAEQLFVSDPLLVLLWARSCARCGGSNGPAPVSSVCRADRWRFSAGFGAQYLLILIASSMAFRYRMEFYPASSSWRSSVSTPFAPPTRHRR